MQTVKTIGLDIAKSVFQVNNTRSCTRGLRPANRASGLFVLGGRFFVIACDPARTSPASRRARLRPLAASASAAGQLCRC